MDPQPSDFVNRLSGLFQEALIRGPNLVEVSGVRRVHHEVPLVNDVRNFIWDYEQVCRFSLAHCSAAHHEITVVTSPSRVADFRFKSNPIHFVVHRDTSSETGLAGGALADLGVGHARCKERCSRVEAQIGVLPF